MVDVSSINDLAETVQQEEKNNFYQIPAMPRKEQDGEKIIGQFSDMLE